MFFLPSQSLCLFLSLWNQTAPLLLYLASDWDLALPRLSNFFLFFFNFGSKRGPRFAALRSAARERRRAPEPDITSTIRWGECGQQLHAKNTFSLQIQFATTPCESVAAQHVPLVGASPRPTLLSQLGIKVCGRRERRFLKHYDDLLLNFWRISKLLYIRRIWLHHVWDQQRSTEFRCWGFCKFGHHFVFPEPHCPPVLLWTSSVSIATEAETIPANTENHPATNYTSITYFGLQRYTVYFYVIVSAVWIIPRTFLDWDFSDIMHTHTHTHTHKQWTYQVLHCGLFFLSFPEVLEKKKKNVIPTVIWLSFCLRKCLIFSEWSPPAAGEDEPMKSVAFGQQTPEDLRV